MKIKIITCNFWGLPWPLSVDKSKRQKNLISIIKDGNFDIIALQEMWMSYDIRKLIKSLQKYNISSKHGGLFNFSGLITLTKFPIEKTSFTAFADLGFHKEFFTNKGLLETKIKLNEKNINIINTHLFFPRNDHQNKFLNSQINQLPILLNHQPTILLGDFNAKNEWLKLPADYQIISTTADETLDQQNKYSLKRLNIINDEVMSPDKIIVNFKTSIINQNIIKNPLVSDHYPLVLELEL